MKLSIVTSLYYSAPYIQEFYERVTKSAEQITENYEIIFVNDGSPDDSLDIALKLHQSNVKVVVVDLSRNFGHHRAMMAGLQYATGEFVFLIDVDLEEEPELLIEFYHKLNSEKDVDVIYGVQEKRKGKLLSRVTGMLYWKLYGLLSSYPIPPNLMTARLMTKRYVDSLLLHKELNLDISGLWQITGYTQLPVKVNEKARSNTTYTFSRKVSLFLNSITGFSNKPLVYIAYIGIAILLLSLCLGLYILSAWLFLGKTPEGYLSIILSLWFLGGLMLFCLGTIAIYIAVIFNEVKKRPYAIVKNLYSGNSPQVMNDNRVDLEKVNKFFSKKFLELGPTPEGVDYNSKEAQEIRFEQLLNLIGSNNDSFSLNDFGCGYGALAYYMASKGMKFKYTGYDISASMISYASKNRPQNVDWLFVDDFSKLSISDYTIACGVFNMKFDQNNDTWKNYILSTLRDISNISKKGFSFNMLTKYSDRLKMRPDLYYGDPLFFFDYCKTKFSKNVALLHNYHLYDFTIIVNKE